MAYGTPILPGTRSENAVPRILSRRLHLYLSPIRLYGIYPSVFPAGFRATCAGKGRMRAARERAGAVETVEATGSWEGTGGRATVDSSRMPRAFRDNCRS